MKNPKIIVFGTLKGGAGKTMNAFNIAGILAEQLLEEQSNERVLVIDVDPQCNLTNNIGIDITDRESITVRDILENSPKNQPSTEDVIIKAPISELPNMDVIPSSIFLFSTEIKLYQRSDRERILKRYIEKNIDEFSNYKYIIIDTNPSMSFTNVNAFLAADHIILSCDVSNNSVIGAELFCQLWDEKRDELDLEDNISALLISNYDGRSNVAKDLVEYTHDGSLKDITLENLISATAALKRTEILHIPINILDPKHKAYTQYKNVVEELRKEGIV